jgi:hypothetical protein
MMHVRFTILIFVFGILGSCDGVHLTRHDDNLWMGTYRVADLTIPYPYFLQKRNSKYVLHDFNGKEIDSCKHSKEIASGDTLHMVHHPFEVVYADSSRVNVFQLNDTLLFPLYEGNKNWKYRAKLIPTLMTGPLSSEDIRKSTINQTYSFTPISENPNDDLLLIKYLSFSKDSVTTRIDYYYQKEKLYSEYQRQKCHFFNIGQRVFMSCNENAENPQPLYQVLDASKNKLTMRYFISDEEIIIHCKSTAYPEDNASQYSNCYDGHVGEYYQSNPDMTYKHGNEYLINKIGKDAPQDQGDGYIVIHFNVNCRHEPGRPGIQMMDRKYQKKSFGPAIVKHILNQVMLLREWPQSESDDTTYPYKDGHAFLMFKIENGKITDLCP